MESISEKELAELARLVEITSDAVALCAADGSVLHVNRQLLSLVREDRARVVGQDIKDLLFSAQFERAQHHKLPFSLDGAENTLMLKLVDGSFIPVRVRAQRLPGRFGLSRRRRGARMLVAIRNMAEEYARDRQTQRLLSRLRASNRRLSGMLSIILATVGSDDMPTLVDTVLNRLTETLEADGATLYFAESGGFKLRGASRGLAEGHAFLPDFVPFGAGIATYVLRAGKACRFSIVGTSRARGGAAGSFYDLDARVSSPLRVQDAPPFKSLIAVPVFFGTQVLGIIELGWRRPTTPRLDDARVLEVICDYLSIELVGLVSAMRSKRTAELTRSLNRLRDAMFATDAEPGPLWREVTDEVRRVLGCHLCPVATDAARGVDVLDFEGGSRVDLPRRAEDLFLSTTAPATRTGAALSGSVLGPSSLHGTEGELRRVRLVRVDLTTGAGRWLADHSLPCQGVYMDLGGEEAPAPVDDAGTGALVPVAPARPRTRFLLLRDGSQEPVDDMEYDYLERLARDFELMEDGRREGDSERRIAQTLQVGMRSALGTVPGIVADSLYSSATKQALVGGDFYTLMRLPDDRAVMVLGDVSGKGVEAASMSAMAKTALTAYAWEGATPVQMVRSLNRMLMGFSRVETFVTAFVAKIDLRARVVTYCSAGHPPTMLLRGGREVELLSVQSGVVGAFESMRFEGGSFTFEPGDTMFMYTDGAIEARDAAGGFFGEQRLRDVLLRRGPQGVHGLCQHVLDELDAFTGSALDDDIALVALRLDGNGE